MGDSLPVALSRCLEAVQGGTHSLQECLESYPEHEKTLAPILTVGNQITYLPFVSPSSNYREASRAKILRHLSNSQNRRAKITLTFSFAKTPAFAALMMFLLVMVFTGNRVAYAANTALPGDSLYSVKTVYEDIRLYAADNVEDVTLHLDFAETRIDEIQLLNGLKRYGNIFAAVDGFEYHMKMAYSCLETVMKEDPVKGGEVAVFVAEKSTENVNMLVALVSEVPSESQPAIQQALVVAAQLSGIKENVPGVTVSEGTTPVNIETDPALLEETGKPEDPGNSNKNDPPGNSGNAGKPEDPGSNNNGNANGNNGNENGNNGNGNGSNNGDNGNNGNGIGNNGDDGGGNSDNNGDNGNNGDGNDKKDDKDKGKDDKENGKDK